ncbi:MAG TPA: phosphatase PAP2 family protein [Anaerolineales bacterium]
MNLIKFWQALLDADLRWTRRLSVAERPGLLRTIAAALAHSGDSWFWGVAFLLLVLLGDQAQRTWALAMLAAVFITALIVLSMKFAIRRRRPQGEWGAIYRRTDPHSFPSGHAARGALLAALGLLWGPQVFGIAAALWAPWVILARVAMGVHYLSDVVAGALLGLIAALILGNLISF